MSDNDPMTFSDAEADRLLLLDRLADRVPELDLDKHEVDWTTLEDGHEGLLVDGGGIDGSNGITSSMPGT